MRFLNLLVNKKNNSIEKDSFKNYYEIIKSISLILIPVIILIVFFILKYSSGPYFIGFNSDPEYAYLFDSLNLVKCNMPAMYWHPGTTVEILSASLIKLIHPFESSSEIVRSVILNPEYYLWCLNIVFLILFIISITVLGFISYRATKNIWVAIILQASPFFSIHALMEISRVRPETLLVTCCAIFAAIIIQIRKYDVTEHINYYIYAFALTISFGIITKITFLPLIIIPILLLPTWKTRLKYLLFTMLGLIVFSFPIIPKYVSMVNWFGILVSHTGRYGTGKASIIDIDSYKDSIVQIILSNTIYSVILLIGIFIIALCLLISMYRKELSNDLEIKALLAIIVAQVAQMLMVAKHPSINSSYHYLLPSLMLSGLAVVFMVPICFRLLKMEIKPKFNIIYAILVAIVFLKVAIEVGGRVEVLKTSLKESLHLNKIVGSDFKNYGVISYLRSSSPFYALNFGNEFSGYKHSNAMYELFPDKYFYNILSKKYFTFKGEMSFDEIKLKCHNKIIFQGTYYDKATNLMPPLKLKVVTSMKYTKEGIFTVDSLQ